MSAVSLTVKTLLGESTITAITSTRVFPSVLPLKTVLPAIAVAMSGEDEEYMLAGASQYPVGSVQIHCCAVTAKAAIELGETVKEALRDKLYTSGQNQAQFQKAGVDFTDFNDEQTLHRRVMSFDVRWR